MTLASRRLRCVALAAAVVCSVLSSFVLSSPASAQTRLEVAKVANDFALIMGDYGNELGTFKKHGVDPRMTLITQAKMVQAVVAGSIDIALASGAALAFSTKGAPLKAVAALSGPPSILVLVVRPDGPVKTMADLRGRMAAVTNTGSLTDWAISQIAIHQKWDPSEIKRVSVGDTPARIATLKTGNADAAVVDIATALDLVERGEVRILVRFGELISKFQNQIIYASDKAIETKPESVRGYVRGWFETVSHARMHKAETVAFAQEALGVRQSVAEKVYDELMPSNFFSRDGKFDPATLKLMSKSFVELKLLASEQDLSQFVDERFLP
jgi:ABC-type nitrate/sulfonate/bicarbonate transport system substrate-binding protein